MAWEERCFRRTFRGGRVFEGPLRNEAIQSGVAYAAAISAGKRRVIHEEEDVGA
jgi:hypothetical protein